MSLISVNNLTFGYDTGTENIFENVSFDIDTNWRLGFIGRNGRGKTTFLWLLEGRYPYSGTISSSVKFDYFPFEVDADLTVLQAARAVIAPYDEWESEMEACLGKGPDEMERYGHLLEQYMDLDGYIIDELIEKEIRKLNVDASVLRRPFGTLSMGERTKVMIAALFLKKNNFLLIDEPTNHLDADGRQCMAQYLRSKKGFILVSHDRYFLDTTIDHVLSINRCNIEVQHGNFTSWQENKNRQDQFEIDQNHKLVKDIVRLEESSKRTAGWSDKVEKTKYNTPVAGLRPDRGYIGHKSAKMMKRAKAIEARREKSVNEKKKLLKNIERSDRLKIHAEEYFRDTLINVDDLTVAYGGRIVLNGLSFTVNSGDRVALRGINGSGKSTVLKLIMGESIIYTGNIKIGSGLTISYVPQDTSFLRGTLRQYANSEGIDESLFRAILDKLNFKISDECADMQTMSGGQKKKVLIASSLSKKANLYVWDEPLNFVDVLSRIQIEKLIAEYEPTMIFVEHDYVFNENVATKVIELS